MLLLFKLEKVACFFHVAGFRQKAAELTFSFAGFRQLFAESNGKVAELLLNS